MQHWVIQSRREPFEPDSHQHLVETRKPCSTTPFRLLGKVAAAMKAARKWHEEWRLLLKTGPFQAARYSTRRFANPHVVDTTRFGRFASSRVFHAFADDVGRKHFVYCLCRVSIVCYSNHAVVIYMLHVGATSMVTMHTESSADKLTCSMYPFRRASFYYS